MHPHLLSSEAAASSHPRALVVDDDPLFRTLLVGMLKQAYTVTAATDGKDGYYKALENPPEIAIVDVQMPVWDGLRLLKALREHPSLSKTGVVMLTSDASRETVLAAIKAGADDYIIKTSLSRHELTQKLAAILQRRTALPAAQTAAAPESRYAAAIVDDSTEKRMQEMMDAWE